MPKGKYGKRLFDEVRYVTGREADSRPGVHGNSRRMLTRARVPQRDPLLAWWRPEDTTDADLF